MTNVESTTNINDECQYNSPENGNYIKRRGSLGHYLYALYIYILHPIHFLTKSLEGHIEKLIHCYFLQVHGGRLNTLASNLDLEFIPHSVFMWKYCGCQILNIKVFYLLKPEQKIRNLQALQKILLIQSIQAKENH